MKIFLELRNSIDFLAFCSIHKNFKLMPCISLNFMMMVCVINSFGVKKCCCSNRKAWREEEKRSKEEIKEDRHINEL